MPEPNRHRRYVPPPTGRVPPGLAGRPADIGQHVLHSCQGVFVIALADRDHGSLSAVSAALTPPR